jgi:hypothetical protein
MSGIYYSLSQLNSSVNFSFLRCYTVKGIKQGQAYLDYLIKWPPESHTFLTTPLFH